MDESNTDTTTSQALNHRQKVSKIPSQTIKAMNDQHITLAHEIEHLLKFWTLDVLAGLFVNEDLFDLQRLQFFQLSFRILI